jgi:hypothetical protein
MTLRVGDVVTAQVQFTDTFKIKKGSRMFYFDSVSLE